MIQSKTPEVGYILNIDDKYHNMLDIECFSQMMKDPSYCYKFYWLEAIVNLISQGIRETTFDEIIDEMIANAWYSVREFHIHLSGIQVDGMVRDGLERAILNLTAVSDLSANASKVEIKNAIQEHNGELKQAKEQLTNMVPYRSLAGFFARSKENANWGSVRRLTEYIRHIDQHVTPLPYTLGENSKLKKEVYFNPAWMAMIQDNTVHILGWIQYEKVKWLQNNNPEVPGLVYKLAPMDEKMRKLSNVRKLWEGVLDVCKICDVFTGSPVIPKKYDVDHFIPWSFVMNDELWIHRKVTVCPSGIRFLKHLQETNIGCICRYMRNRRSTSGLKPVTGIICTRSGRDGNCIARETAKKSSAISFGKICVRSMIRREGRGMRYGIIRY